MKKPKKLYLVTSHSDPDSEDSFNYIEDEQPEAIVGSLAEAIEEQETFGEYSGNVYLLDKPIDKDTLARVGLKEQIANAKRKAAEAQAELAKLLKKKGGK